MNLDSYRAFLTTFSLHMSSFSLSDYIGQLYLPKCTWILADIYQIAKYKQRASGLPASMISHHFGSDKLAKKYDARNTGQREVANQSAINTTHWFDIDICTNKCICVKYKP